MLSYFHKFFLQGGWWAGGLEGDLTRESCGQKGLSATGKDLWVSKGSVELQKDPGHGNPVRKAGLLPRLASAITAFSLRHQGAPSYQLPSGTGMSLGSSLALRPSSPPAVTLCDIADSSTGNRKWTWRPHFSISLPGLAATTKPCALPERSLFLAPTAWPPARSRPSVQFLSR